MGSERDLAADLAEEIRAAVRQAAPAAPRQAPEPREEDGESVRVPLRRAEAHVTPTIPEGVRFCRAKRFLLRALRFLWRDQTAFNALQLEASGALLQEVEGVRARLRELSHDIEKWEEDLRRWNEAWERRAAIQDGRLGVLEAERPATAPASETPGRAPALPAGVYSLFEERFRGSPEEIAEKQRFYLSLLKDVPGPIFDVGCGRGEFLRLAAADGHRASGVEINPIAVSTCREQGLEVEQGDAVESLARKPSGSLGAVVAFQVVEHWSSETTFVFLREVRRALAQGGTLIVETINTDSLSALKAFFLDPSHVRPVPPEALRFLAQAAGFTETRIEYRAPCPPEERLAEASENDAKLNRLLFGPQDYALVARVPGP